jgi:TM2 domain-containing membrane protein YozV
METEWYLVREQGGQQYGPFPTSELQSLVDEGRMTRTDRVWSEGMSDWAKVSDLSHLGLNWEASRKIPPPLDNPFTAADNPYAPPFSPITNGGGPRFDPADRFIAAALAILLPGLGVHKFFYGATGAGITMLLVTLLTCGFGGIIMSPISIIEGVIYLTKSPEEFHRLYRVEKKGWF